MSMDKFQDPEPSTGEHFRKMAATARRVVGRLAAKLSSERPQFVEAYKFSYYMEGAGMAFDGQYEKFSAPLVVGPQGLKASADHPVIVLAGENRTGKGVKNYYVSMLEESKSTPGLYGVNTYQVKKFLDGGQVRYGLMDQRDGPLEEIPIANGVLDGGSEIFTLSHMDRLGALPSTVLDVPEDIDTIAAISAELTHVLAAIHRIHG